MAWKKPEHVSGIIEQLFASWGILLPSSRTPIGQVPVQGMLALSMANGPTYGFADASEPRTSAPVQPMQAVAECPVCHYIDRADPRPDRCPNCGESKPME